MNSSLSQTQTERRRWMGVLASSDSDALEEACDRLRPFPQYLWLRLPETGLVMIRARVGGTGARFNLGEMTLTRCTLRIEGGATGVAYVRGRSARHAELSALVDALMQDAKRADEVNAAVIAPLEERQQAKRRAAECKAATTRVDFYTVARGED